MVYRIYVEKKPGFDVEAQGLKNELVSLLGIQSLSGLRLLNRYDVEGIDEALFNQCATTVFSEPPVDNTYAELPEFEGISFAVEYLPGQFDQRADSAAECIQLISQGERPLVRSARVYLLEGSLTEEQVAEIKKYVINPVEAREASLETKATLKMEYPVPTAVATLEGFNELDEEGLKKFIDEKGLAMDLGDIKFCQEYFRSEHRDPTITEIKMIDTYWSDHCRHTTFGTILDDVQIDDAVVQAAFDRYMAMRADLGREEKPRCMMDLATIGAKELKKQGILKNLDESEEINACTVKIKCDVNGKDEDWLFLFKNETHNHPTEIEPFGGAATCIGGAMTGLGGLYLVMNAASGVGGAWVYNCIDGYGWLAVALVIFAVWSPKRALWCSLIFGGLACMRYYYPISFIPASIYDIVPYIVTAIVLVAVSLKHSRANQPPESLGLSYFREER